jgi:hypothetical protein
MIRKRDEKEPIKGDKRYIRRDNKGRVVVDSISERKKVTEGQHVTISPKSGRSAIVHSHGSVKPSKGHVEKARENDDAAFNKLMALRQKIVASGQQLLTWDEINKEVANRRV